MKNYEMPEVQVEKFEVESILTGASFGDIEPEDGIVNEDNMTGKG